MTVTGQSASRFDNVRAVFAENLENGDDLGAACAVSVDGELVVDLIGGYQDRKKERRWQTDTIASIFSSGKAVVALLVAQAVEAGLLDYNQQVAHYWPEFAAAGKDTITLAQVMSHQAGLCGLPEEMDPAMWLDWDAICAKLAAMTPMWSVGSANGYHPQTYGFLAGEILRRVTGQTVGGLIRDNFVDPHGIQIFCGLKEDEPARTVIMVKPTQLPDFGELNDYRRAAFLTRWAAPAGVSREDWAAAEIPASNMHADARSLARLMSIIACAGEFEGKKLLSEQTLSAMSAEQCRGDDLVLPFNLSWACGFMRNNNHLYGPLETTLGHSGSGGSCVYADPVNRLSFAFVLNKMSHHLVGDPRTLRLIDAVYKSL